MTEKPQAKAAKDPFGPDSRHYRTPSGEPAPYPNGHTRETWEAGACSPVSLAGCGFAR